MSSGQKAWEEEIEREAMQKHCQRLESVGYYQIACIVDDIYLAIDRLDKGCALMSRAGWETVDNLKHLIRKLK